MSWGKPRAGMDGARKDRRKLARIRKENSAHAR